MGRKSLKQLQEESALRVNQVEAEEIAKELASQETGATSEADLDETVPGRRKRKKVYERISESAIPQEIKELFAKDNYALRFVRWSLNGEEDYRYLSRRENEGYEFVRANELPKWYLASLRIMDTHNHNSIVTAGDLCLMKVDMDLQNSRRDHYQGITNREIAAVDVNVLEKKGLRNLGTRSKVVMRTPTFSD